MAQGSTAPVENLLATGTVAAEVRYSDHRRQGILYETCPCPKVEIFPGKVQVQARIVREAN
jgi:hypothetical protein